MSEDKASYKQIFRATSIFGGVQVFSIILSIIRSKVIAVLLGPAGMGVAGMLTSTTGFISSLTNFGLGISSIQNIAAANETGNPKRVATVITVLRRLVWVTGLLGMLVTLFLSRWLSNITFGNSKYTLAFIWLSLTLLFNQLTSGRDVLLQGLRELRSLAKASVLGSFIGLLVSIPLYYFFRVNGIVPALIATSIVTMIIAYYFTRNIEVEKIEVTRRETVTEGKDMLRMGVMLSLSSLILAGGSYIVRLYISNTGGIAEVGLYNAGFAIIGTYVGLIFSAMATDFYPRLSGVAHDNQQAADLINHQAEIAILILSPILCVFLIFINWVVIFLYSNDFIPVNGMIHWTALGMYFKAASWSIAFILLAKGASKLFFWNELVANIYTLFLNIGGYELFGLDGLGISFMIGYGVYLLQVYLLARQRYEFYFKKVFLKIFVVQLSLGLLSFMVIEFIPIPFAFLLGSVIIALSFWYSFVEMDKRIGIKSIFKNFAVRKL